MSAFHRQGTAYVDANLTAGSAAVSPSPRSAPVLASSASVESLPPSTYGVGERQSLLSRPSRRKPFYRARPLWLVPFALTAAIVRGMTLAPRVEVYTQLACAQLNSQPFNHTTTIDTPINQTRSHMLPLAPRIHLSVHIPAEDDLPDDDPRDIPSNRCQTNPKVQAGAARIQTIMTTTMGILSALTTGWWGQFGERHGRTRVLAISTFGLLLTDVFFIMVSTPNSIFATHGHKLLVIAPVIEGLLGGWSTLQSATSAYVGDCTSISSRATVFSRLMGTLSIGLAIGPAIGGYFIQHGTGAHKNVTMTFWVAIACSAINFIAAIFVLPESRAKEDQAREAEVFRQARLTTRKVPCSPPTSDDGNISGPSTQKEVPSTGILASFLSPLKLFLPATIIDAQGSNRRDWSLTYLATVLFMYYLSTGIYQIKYLYAGHVFEWGADKLGYYISFMGLTRAIFLLVVLPWIISAFKSPPQPTAQTSATTTKAKPTRLQVMQAIKFDLSLAKLSLVSDLISHLLVTLAPAQSAQSSAPGSSSYISSSEAIFVGATSLTSIGAAAIPSLNSLALSILQARSQLAGKTTSSGRDNVTGSLFGALAVLQAVGQMIIGPMIFGLMYSSTVARFPKSIFVLAGAIAMVGLVGTALLRNPLKVARKKPKSRRQRIREEEESRGRSRVSKDLFGHYQSGPTQQYRSV